MLVSFHTEIWHPSLLNIIHASVWQWVLPYQNTIIPKYSAKESLYMGILIEASSLCLIWAWRWKQDSGHQQLALCLHPLTAMCLGSLSMLYLKWKQQKLSLLTAALKHGCSFGNHLWPLPLDHRSLVMPSGMGCIVLLAPLQLEMLAKEKKKRIKKPSILKRKILKIKIKFLFNKSQEIWRGLFFQPCHKDSL